MSWLHDLKNGGPSNKLYLSRKTYMFRNLRIEAFSTPKILPINMADNFKLFQLSTLVGVSMFHTPLAQNPLLVHVYIFITDLSGKERKSLYITWHEKTIKASFRLLNAVRKNRLSFIIVLGNVSIAN